MSRHLADHRTPPGPARFSRFIAIARAEVGHKAERVLFLRKPTRAGSARLMAFLRVERGHQA